MSMFLSRIGVEKLSIVLKETFPILPWGSQIEAMQLAFSKEVFSVMINFLYLNKDAKDNLLAREVVPERYLLLFFPDMCFSRLNEIMEKNPLVPNVPKI